MNTLSPPCYSTHQLENYEVLNAALKSGFYQHHLSTDIKRSHFFQGRYENIYIDEEKIPEIKQLLNLAITHVEKLLSINPLQAALWFNLMPPDSVTEPHTHDDDDELLSCVYYIRVPKESGKLLIHNQAETVSITPQEGLFVFFKPDIIHQVSNNQSTQDRLSVGINFGLKKTAQ